MCSRICCVMNRYSKRLHITICRYISLQCDCVPLYLAKYNRGSPHFTKHTLPNLSVPLVSLVKREGLHLIFSCLIGEISRMVRSSSSAPILPKLGTDQLGLSGSDHVSACLLLGATALTSRPSLRRTFRPERRPF